MHKFLACVKAVFMGKILVQVLFTEYAVTLHERQNLQIMYWLNQIINFTVDKSIVSLTYV